MPGESYSGSEYSRKLATLDRRDDGADCRRQHRQRGAGGLGSFQQRVRARVAGSIARQRAGVVGMLGAAGVWTGAGIRLGAQQQRTEGGDRG